MGYSSEHSTSDQVGSRGALAIVVCKFRLVGRTRKLVVAAAVKKRLTLEILLYCLIWLESGAMDEFSAHKLDAAVTLSAHRTAVLIVDMLNDFCKPGGAMVLPGYERLILPQQTVLDAARRSGATVIFVVDAHRQNVRRDREFLKRTPHCIENTWGAG